jgi:hypothetical protein
MDDRGDRTSASGLRVSLALLYGLLLIWGLTLGMVGLWDTVSTSSLGNRLISVVLAMIGVAIVFGAIIVVRTIVSSRQWSRGIGVVSLVTAGLALAVGLTTLAAVQSNFTAQTRLVVARYLVLTIIIVSLVAGVLATAKLIREAPVDDATRETPVGGGTTQDESKDVTKQSFLSEHRPAIITAIASIVAALIAVPQVWYSSQYVPSSATPVVSIKSKLSKPRPHGDG